ncbi:hypothetical protein [Gimesia sp.]|uniref:hypothetical protein n=1 Tax=Gimesia sp. TaxID=2024833 RepID=UPI000C6279B8|nr:hypothetical protein [Gimesia sp.]MAX38663.1 hypothetical protein [Gimesia sp.]HAH48398.1 hypothetical protein [Planctomycetaceae bacterium]HBL43720.1 hypothetical protein [Planctomycetaceae bacterium]|tara:strand:- start:2197 stop:2700 length:504 start_codon:yes stop_codon:yes gene_type:complete
MMDPGRRAEKNILVKSVRAVVGLAGAYVFLTYVFLFLGLLQLDPVLNLAESRMQTFLLWLIFALACGFGLFTAFSGTVKVSRFWHWFLVMFGLTSLLQIVPGKGGLRPELYLDWPQWTVAAVYVRPGFQFIKLVVLLIHVGLSLGVAWGIHSGCPRLFRWQTPRISS